MVLAHRSNAIEEKTVFHPFFFAKNVLRGGPSGQNSTF